MPYNLSSGTGERSARLRSPPPVPVSIQCRCWANQGVRDLPVGELFCPNPWWVASCSFRVAALQSIGIQTEPVFVPPSSGTGSGMRSFEPHPTSSFFFLAGFSGAAEPHHWFTCDSTQTLAKLVGRLSQRRSNKWRANPHNSRQMIIRMCANSTRRSRRAIEEDVRKFSNSMGEYVEASVDKRLTKAIELHLAHGADQARQETIEFSLELDKRLHKQVMSALEGPVVEIIQSALVEAAGKTTRTWTRPSNNMIF